MWARDQVDIVVDLLNGLQCALVKFSEMHIDVILPGCTHLQHAQPVLLSHQMLAYVEMFARDAERFSELRKRVNVMPWVRRQWRARPIQLIVSRWLKSWSLILFRRTAWTLFRIVTI